jgi:hypothetical protein
MLTNIQNYQISIIKNKKLKFYNFTNCKCAFSSSQVCTCMQNYQITKLPKSPKLQSYKLQVHFCLFTNLHMLNLHIFIFASTTKL